MRINRGFTQRDMAARAGIKLATYRRLERGGLKNPPVRFLINCAIVLNCELRDIWEPAWNEWCQLNGAKEPTDAMRTSWEVSTNRWDTPSDELLDSRSAEPGERIAAP